jgi:hypothetical protein
MVNMPTRKQSDAQTLPSSANPTNTLPRMAFTMRETAALLGVNYQTVYRLNKRGLLRSSSALRTKLFPATEIQRFLTATLGQSARSAA